MFKKAKPARDAFTFSLGGIRTIAFFAAVPTIADDRINKIRDERLKQVSGDRNLKPRLWRRSRRQAA